MNLSWKRKNVSELKKLIFALNTLTLEKLIKQHEERGWEVISEVKEHGNGLAVVAKYPLKSKGDNVVNR